MIYLFDDNEFGQMSSNYGVDMLEELSNFPKLIKHINKVAKNEELDDMLKIATAIFIHASFSPSKLKDYICKKAEERHIPLVVFTGQEPTTIWDDKNPKIIRKIKKDRFYHYLIPFLKHCQEYPQESLEIRKLVFGKNYEVEKSLIIQDRLGLFLSFRTDIFNYESDFKISTQERKDLLELFFFLYPENYEIEFLNFHNRFKNQQTDARSFFIEIKNLVSTIIHIYE
ncbi:MAG: hypothetical protein SF052_25475 [Bacteroidia bacterium]|nr:hypothetical protein [Bacteroidia bacterium]